MSHSDTLQLELNLNTDGNMNPVPEIVSGLTSAQIKWSVYNGDVLKILRELPDETYNRLLGRLSKYARR